LRRVFEPTSHPTAIDGKGHAAAVHLANSQFLRIEDVEIVNDNSQPIPPPKNVPAKPQKEQKGAKKIVNYGVWITANAQRGTRDIHLKRLKSTPSFPPDPPPPKAGQILPITATASPSKTTRTTPEPSAESR